MHGGSGKRPASLSSHPLRRQRAGAGSRPQLMARAGLRLGQCCRRARCCGNLHCARQERHVPAPWVRRAMCPAAGGPEFTATRGRCAHSARGPLRLAWLRRWRRTFHTTAWPPAFPAARWCWPTGRLLSLCRLVPVTAGLSPRSLQVFPKELAPPAVCRRVWALGPLLLALRPGGPQTWR